jgi:hypothetical protein
MTETNRLELFWFLPTSGDGPYLGSSQGHRPADYDYLRQVAVAARLREYQALGIETVIASGYPHLEEAYRVAELLFQVLGIERGSATPAGREFRPVASRPAQAHADLTGVAAE